MQIPMTNPEEDLTQGQRDAIQHVSETFPYGYYMMLCTGHNMRGQPLTHVLMSYANMGFLRQWVGERM